MSVDLIIAAIGKRIKSKHYLFAIFDRDGTLVPINADANAAILHKNVLELLLKLDAIPHTKVAILSARDLAQLRHDIKDKNLILSGNYGMELHIPNQQTWQQPEAIQSRNLLLEVKSEIQKRLSEKTQVLLEDHLLTLCLHWHLTPSKYREEVHNCIKTLKAKYRGLLFKSLPTSYEVWPPIQWDKSNGLIQMTSLLQLDLKKYLLLYVGDSESDEAAFAWVNEHEGITVRVGQHPESVAQFTVESTQEVQDILNLLIENIKSF